MERVSAILRGSWVVGGGFGFEGMGSGGVVVAWKAMRFLVGEMGGGGGFERVEGWGSGKGRRYI